MPFWTIIKGKEKAFGQCGGGPKKSIVRYPKSSSSSSALEGKKKGIYQRRRRSLTNNGAPPKKRGEGEWTGLYGSGSYRQKKKWAVPSWILFSSLSPTFYIKRVAMRENFNYSPSAPPPFTPNLIFLWVDGVKVFSPPPPHSTVALLQILRSADIAVALG